MLRTNFVESVSRLPFFRCSPPTRMWVSSRRLPMMHRFGWEIGADGVLIEKEDEQRALAEMQALRARGMSYRAISEHMRTEFGISLSHQGVKRALNRLVKGGTE